MPQLIVPPGEIQPIYTLIWRAQGLRADVTRTMALFLRCAAFVFGTITLGSSVVLPVVQATTWFMATVGIFLFDRVVSTLSLLGGENARFIRSGTEAISRGSIILFQ